MKPAKETGPYRRGWDPDGPHGRSHWRTEAQRPIADISPEEIDRRFYAALKLIRWRRFATGDRVSDTDQAPMK